MSSLACWASGMLLMSTNAFGAELPTTHSVIPGNERLVSESACLACHSASPRLAERFAPPSAPRLSALGARAEPTWLRSFLSRVGVHGGAPWGGAVSLEPSEVEALAHFLGSETSAPTAEPLSFTVGHLERGRRAFHSLGCIACHEPFEHAWERDLPFLLSEDSATAVATEEEPDAEDAEESYVAPGTFAAAQVELRDLERRHTVQSLAVFLQNPLAARPDGRMPDFRLDAREAEELAIYLLREQALEGDRVGRGQPGLSFERFDGVVASALPDFDELIPNETGVVFNVGALPPHPDDEFGLRYRGSVLIPHAGSWTFSTVSDDGSSLWLGGELLVNNDGLHGAQEAVATRELEPGAYAIEVNYWEAGGDEVLEVYWEGPNVPRQLVPPEALFHRALRFRAESPASSNDGSVELKRQGSTIYERLGCATCHEPEIDRTAPDWGELSPDSSTGCLSPTPKSGLPAFEFSDADRLALGSLVRAGEELTELSSAERITRTLARFQCYACHRRDGRGGVHPSRAEYFQSSGDYDLGDEGRLPPHLSGVGSKLKPAALRNVLTTGVGVRPYLAARMPVFGDQNIGHLAELFRDVDGAPQVPAPNPTPEMLRVGRQLVGTRDGLGCIHCHRFAGHDSLGIQAVDLLDIDARIEPAWFTKLLMDPASVEMNSRMPSFLQANLSPVDVYDRAPEPQIEAIRAYLAQGSSASLPFGLVTPDSQFEVDPLDEPRSVAVFMEGVSPRTLLVGTPAGVHIAFDAQRSRLAKVWRGRFFNARGTWNGRAGALESPPGSDILDLPPGPPIARLPDANSAWPDMSTPRRLGQDYNADGLPVFRYKSDGLTTAESFRPTDDSVQGKRGLVRDFHLSSKEPLEDLWFRLHVGDALPQLRGSWSSGDVVRREHEAGSEWIVRVPMHAAGSGYVANWKVEVYW